MCNLHPTPPLTETSPTALFMQTRAVFSVVIPDEKKEVCYLDTSKQWFKYLRSGLVMPQGSSRVWGLKKDELTKTVCKNWYWPLEEINLFNTFGDETLTVFVVPYRNPLNTNSADVLFLFFTHLVFFLTAEIFICIFVVNILFDFFVPVICRIY